MKREIIALLIICLLPRSIFGQIGEKNFIDQNYIEVIGKSEMEIAPDKIFIKVNINEKDTKNKSSVADLEKSMMSTLKAIGIDVTKDLIVKDISSNFKSYLFSKNEILLSKEYQILVRDGKTASQVFIGLERIGISNVSIEKLDNSKIEQYRKEVKISAIKAAKDKAESLSKAIDQNIGRAIYIQELMSMANQFSNSNNIVIRGYGSVPNNTIESEPDIDFEKIKIESSVLCRFELK
jgi:uncharacterized protein